MFSTNRQWFDVHRRPSRVEAHLCGEPVVASEAQDFLRNVDEVGVYVEQSVLEFVTLAILATLWLRRPAERLSQTVGLLNLWSHDAQS